MDSRPSYPILAPLALFLMISASGCSPSIKPAVRPVLPDMPATTASPCVDPGVASDAYVALTEARVALAACRRKHSDAVAFYQDVKGRIE
jgi:hypothetical protein